MTKWSKESLVGTWKLVSNTSTNDTGEVFSFGPNPIGLLTYTADGRMSVVNARSDRKPPSIPPSIEERAEAFLTCGAYAGSYTVDGDKVVHHIEVCSVQNIGDTDQVRTAKLEGDRLTLRGGFAVKGVIRAAKSELVWERLKLETTNK
jgi:hypothetical protein